MIISYFCLLRNSLVCKNEMEFWIGNNNSILIICIMDRNTYMSTFQKGSYEEKWVILIIKQKVLRYFTFSYHQKSSNSKNNLNMTTIMFQNTNIPMAMVERYVNQLVYVDTPA